MGMQNVRAILPEQIDLVINTSITDYVNQLIRESIGITNDRIVTDNSKLGQINALRSLYKVIEVDANPNNTETEPPSPFVKSSETLTYRETASIKNFTDDGNFDYLFLVDFAMNYKCDRKNLITNYFPVRLIDDAFLADTLNDFVLRPRFRSPIAIVYADTINIYIDNVKNEQLPENLTPYKLRVSYIGKPREVKYLQDVGQPNIDCDLPDYTHVDLLKHAVDLYRTAISGAMLIAKNQEQQASQEAVRNNYRNDGNQQQ